MAEAVAQIRKLLAQDAVLMSDDAELTEYVCGNDDELMEACKQFETYFIEQVFKHAQTAMIPQEESTDGATKTLLDYYKDSLTSEYAKLASDQQENGLAQMLYEQMKRNFEI